MGTPARRASQERLWRPLVHDRYLPLILRPREEGLDVAPHRTERPLSSTPIFRSPSSSRWGGFVSAARSVSRRGGTRPGASRSPHRRTRPSTSSSAGLCEPEEGAGARRGSAGRRRARRAAWDEGRGEPWNAGERGRPQPCIDEFPDDFVGGSILCGLRLAARFITPGKLGFAISTWAP
jgi:hypothetical protein